MVVLNGLIVILRTIIKIKQMAIKIEKLTATELKAVNPWKGLIKKIKNDGYELKRNQKYFDEKDKDIIEDINKKFKDTDYEVHLEILPFHFSGNILDAPIMLLTANPGYVADEEKKGFHTDKKFIRETIEDFTFEKEFLLTDSIDRMVKSDYYYKKLWRLMETYGFEKVSKNVSLLEFFPYHSVKFKNADLPSQKFGVEIVKYAIEQRKLIVIMRSERNWYDAVKELKKYPNKVVLKNYRQPYVTEGNCQPKEDFHKILKVLDKCT